MSEETIILNPENTGDPIEQVWMFVSRDASGRENVCGTFTPLGATPLVTGNPEMFEDFKLAARVIADSDPVGKTIHLLKFTNREELEGWR